MHIRFYKNWLLIPFALSICVVLSSFSIRAALASHYADQGTLEGYKRATSLEPGNPDYWYRLGDAYEHDLEHSDVQRAIQAYRTALALVPNFAVAWAGLASAYEEEGNLVASRQAFLNAKRAYPQSADISWRYANFLLRSGELDSAFVQAREAVERDPGRAWAAFSLFQRADQDVDSILARLLPNQRGVYLDIIWGLEASGQTKAARRVWSRTYEYHKSFPSQIIDGHAQTTEYILLSLVDRLIASDSIEDAQQVWDEGMAFMNIPQKHEPLDSLIWDGGFESDLAGGFSWRINSQPGASVKFDKSNKHSGDRALQISFDGKRNLDLNCACQYVAVQPGCSYNFSAWMKTENITTDKGVFFRLSAPQNKEPETGSVEVTGTNPWRELNVRWTAAADVRLLQVCAARDKSYQQYNTISGRVWIDDVRLVPVQH